LKAKLLLLTFAGGAIGSALRFVISEASGSQVTALWLVNLFGALLLGFVHTSKLTATAENHAFLATGFAGGFTTVSGLLTFALLAPEGNFQFVALQVAVGIAIYWLGRIAGGERTWSKS
jgi:fluoride ion exporter CrcB/FEX